MANGSPRLLVVEDDRNLGTGLKLNFELEGYTVDLVHSVREAGAQLLESGRYAAIILDVMLPDNDEGGFVLCRKLRDAGDFTPVLMLTARDRTNDRVRGLEAGADDYLVKPFELDELLARVRSLLRRRDWEQQVSEEPRERLYIGTAQIDFAARTCETGGEEIKLTALEFDLLRYFAENPNRVLSRQELQQKVWKLDNYPNSRMVDNFILRLRKHFEEDPKNPRYFVSVRGAGYKFVP
ncbi:response regulator transcription factor [Pseudenhygromyxa sp. WMMC2535]|uniref:response regulator transcription factor n=1 Tax=Pseudenhygromyxa sp. WMMC2535 TaxID=2712867 RepID=UPI00155173B1|nr:response regulator transcription factor [Pseudenhygromyxa sp. WMMC2535]NVB38019.1 response regulator transcription factor [Pseudenhygromyxa sp. WMMC2535]